MHNQQSEMQRNALEEGKTERFFGNYNEETLFRMDIPAEGRITVDTCMFAGTLYLCDADKKEIIVFLRF